MLTREEKNDANLMVLMAAIRDDYEAAGDLLSALYEDNGGKAMAYAVFSWMGMVNKHLEFIRAKNEGALITFPGLLDRDTWKMIETNSEECPRDMAMALRMYTYFANGDPDMAATLFGQSMKDGYGDEVVVAVLTVAAEILGPMMMERGAGT